MILGRVIVGLGLAVVANTLVTTDAVDMFRIQDASRRTVELPSTLRQAVAAIATRHADRDGDGVIDAPAMDMTAPAPAAGGLVPAAIGAPAVDPWGARLGYCAWKLGPGAVPVGMLRGATTSSGSEISFAVVSSGPDRSFQTSCADALAGSATGDDKLQTYSLADVALATEGVGGVQAVAASTSVQTQQTACAAKGKLYAGAVQGADADGCVAPASSGGIVTDSQGRLAVSCNHISQLVAGPQDGEYLVLGVPTDGSLPAMYPTECDFTTYGGKWSLVAKYDPTEPCPATLKPGGFCSAPTDGIDLMSMGRITNDLASVRANTNALRYLKPWAEILIKDSNGGWMAWTCGGGNTSWYERFIAVASGTSCTLQATSFGASQSLNTLLPRFQVNLTGYREITSTQWSWWSCPAFHNCEGDWTARSAVQRDFAGYSGNYYFGNFYVLFPAQNAASGTHDFQNKVCPSSPVVTPDVTSIIGGTLANGCAMTWNSTYRGPWRFTAGPTHDWSYAVDYPGDVGQRMPSLAHLATQPRPNQTWAPEYRMVIAGPTYSSWMRTSSWLTQPSATDGNSVCYFGFGSYDQWWGNGAASGGGVFFVPTSHLIYGNGTLSNVMLSWGGPWMDGYNFFEFSGGQGQFFAIPGYVDLKLSMMNGTGGGKSVCAGTRRYAWGSLHQEGYCQNVTYRDVAHFGFFPWGDGCQGVQASNKTETPFNALPGNVPMGLIKSYMPTDIRKIYIR